MDVPGGRDARQRPSELILVLRRPELEGVQRAPLALQERHLPLGDRRQRLREVRGVQREQQAYVYSNCELERLV